MTLDKLIARLQAIRTAHPEYGGLEVIYRSHRYVPDKRRRNRERLEDSFHSVEYGCSGRIGGVIDGDAVEITGDVIHDWS